MKAFTKLLVLGAALAVSTSFAYADTLGVGSLSFGPDGYGSGITYTSNSMEFWGGQTVQGLSTGSLSMFTGAVNVVYNNIPSFTAITANTEFFTTTATDGSHDVLTYFLDSLSGTDIAGILNVHGTGYFTDSAFSGQTPASLSFSTSGGGLGIQTTAYEGSASITPEPSSLLLLGTGLLGAAGIARRKFAAKFV